MELHGNQQRANTTKPNEQQKTTGTLDEAVNHMMGYRDQHDHADFEQSVHTTAADVFTMGEKRVVLKK